MLSEDTEGTSKLSGNCILTMKNAPSEMGAKPQQLWSSDIAKVPGILPMTNWV